MISCDTLSLSAYLRGKKGDDVEQVETALVTGQLALPPVVLTEILSDVLAGPMLDDLFAGLSTLPLKDGYWIRAAHTRRRVRTGVFVPRTTQALVAQACIDADVPLITRDDEFRYFAQHCGLKLA